MKLSATLSLFLLGAAAIKVEQLTTPNEAVGPIEVMEVQEQVDAVEDDTLLEEDVDEDVDENLLEVDAETEEEVEGYNKKFNAMELKRHN